MRLCFFYQNTTTQGKSLTSKNRDYYLFPIGVKSNIRNKLISFLLENKIFVTVNFRSITNLSYYKKKYKVFDCKESKKWGEETLSLPFHSKITKNEIKIVSKKIQEFFSKTIQ